MCGGGGGIYFCIQISVNKSVLILFGSRCMRHLNWFYCLHMCPAIMDFWFKTGRIIGQCSLIRTSIVKIVYLICLKAKFSCYYEDKKIR